jgi:hypothetical protein
MHRLTQKDAMTRTTDDATPGAGLLLLLVGFGAGKPEA